MEVGKGLNIPDVQLLKEKEAIETNGEKPAMKTKSWTNAFNNKSSLKQITDKARDLFAG